MGLDACFMNTNSAVHGDIGMIHDKDLVIILTKSGATSESVYLHGLLNKRNCNQWLLTFEKTGILSQKMQNKITVQLQHEGDMWNIVPNNSTTVNLIVLQTLAIELGKRMQITLEQFKENHPGGHIGEMLQNYKKKVEFNRKSGIFCRNLSIYRSRKKTGADSVRVGV